MAEELGGEDVWFGGDTAAVEDVACPPGAGAGLVARGTTPFSFFNGTTH